MHSYKFEKFKRKLQACNFLLLGSSIKIFVLILKIDKESLH